MSAPDENQDCQQKLFYPNKFARIIIDSLEDEMGSSGLHAVLRLANLEKYLEERPPNNFQKAFPFADLTDLQVALEEMYGPRGGQGLAVRAGRATFDRGLRGVGALVGVGDLAFRALPLNSKMKIGLPAVARIFSQFSDQVSRVYDEGEHFVYTLEKCPMCCNRQADHPVCFFGLGFLQEALSWVSGGHNFRIEMSTCQAQGDDMGRYFIYKRPLD